MILRTDIFTARPASRPTYHRRCGFTLVEMLLVVAIIGIISVIAMPTMVHSIRGNRLRTAARTVVMAGRYARSMALVRQQELLLTIDLGSASVSVAPGTIASFRSSTNHGEKTSAELSQKTFGVTPDRGSAAMDDVSPPPEGTQGPAGQKLNITRQLEGVKIDSVEVGEETAQTEGTAIIPFYSNGRCEPYSVNISDDSGAVMHIKVDPLGSARTEREER